ncbi:hypothetical protein QR685DRAFT_175169 [Neurospora intermedia]|uniref:Uncharacterized protein n=1 Tax=Neurospora intermedia TaxID=5142 RepID=A0ABR3DLF3_NEUIN
MDTRYLQQESPGQEKTTTTIMGGTIEQGKRTSVNHVPYLAFPSSLFFVAFTALPDSIEMVGQSARNQSRMLPFLCLSSFASLGFPISHFGSPAQKVRKQRG